MNADTYANEETLIIKALAGDPEAQCAIADLYADDSRAELFNVAKAVAWYEKAAEQGHAKAQWILGTSYAQGMGVDKDPAKAEHWLIKSAQSGDTEGQYMLGGYYFMKPDIMKAAYWLEKASDQGHGEARIMLQAVNLLLANLT